MRVDKQGKARSARPHDWTDVLAPEVISQFEGKHIAIVYKRVVASGETFDAVLEESLHLFPEETPYLAYIPTRKELESEDYSVAGTRVRGQSSGFVRESPVELVSEDMRLTHELKISDRTTEVADATLEVTAISPIKGAIGTAVKITGIGFSRANEISFGGTTSKSFKILSDTSITSIVPEGAITGPVAVFAGQVSSASVKSFVVLNAPVITSCTPLTGAVGARIKLNGNYLGDAVKIAFQDQVAAPILLATPVSIETEVPEGAVSGRISVTNAGGTTWTQGNFIVIGPPSISSVSPMISACGSTVTVHGSNLTSISSAFIGDQLIETFHEISANELALTIPDGVASGVISVSTPGGTATSGERLSIIQQPTIKSVAPATGGVGAKIMITGANLAATTSVEIAGAAVQKFTVISPAFVSFIVPHGASTGPISLHTGGGAAVSSAIFVVIPAPVIESVDPVSGPPGTKITIKGENLSNPEGVFLNNLPVNSFTVESSSEITFSLEQAAQNGVFKVVTMGGSAESTGQFLVVPLPTIQSFTPTFGPVGTVVTVTGKNLESTNAAYVNKLKANVSAVTGSKATVFIPNDSTTGPISLVTPFGICQSSAEFEVISASAIKDIIPSSGIAGSLVTIIGWGFRSVSSVLFDSVPSQAISANSNNTISVQVPFGATSGEVVVLGPNGAASGTREFNVTLTIHSVAPEFGPAGTSVVLSGVGFTGASAVYFNGVKADFEALTDYKIMVTVPKLASDGKIRIVTPLGTTESAAEFLTRPI